jgi:uncharacterized protein YqgC (DUF456 family)
MVTTVAWIALGLLVLGVVGSLIPGLPGAILSLSGVYLFWWQSGYTEPGLLLLVGLTLVGLLTVAVDWLAGALAAKASGASTTTTVLAGLAGLVLLFVAGPFGVILGIAGVVFAVEFSRGGDAEASLRSAAITTLGMLGSNLVQALLTGSMLAVMLVVVFW